MRLFVAIQLSEDVRGALIQTMHDLKKQGVKGDYVPAKNLHLTLAFIGEVKESRSAAEALQSVKAKPFKLSLSDMGTFGDILWAGVKGNQGISGAAKAVRDALGQAGIAYDQQKFVPHITLIRKAGGNWKGVPAPKGGMLVKKISLMKSQEDKGKVVYSEVASVSL